MDQLPGTSSTPSLKRLTGSLNCDELGGGTSRTNSIHCSLILYVEIKRFGSICAPTEFTRSNASWAGMVWGSFMISVTARVSYNCKKILTESMLTEDNLGVVFLYAIILSIQSPLKK